MVSGDNETSLTSLDSYASGSSHVSHSSSTSRSSSTSQASKGKPLTHDYAILEPPKKQLSSSSSGVPPPDHDYAILDPEYHEEFYGEWCNVHLYVCGTCTPEYHL